MLDRLLYRNRSQHRSAKYFTLALEVSSELYTTVSCEVVYRGVACYIGIWRHFLLRASGRKNFD